MYNSTDLRHLLEESMMTMLQTSNDYASSCFSTGEWSREEFLEVVDVIRNVAAGFSQLLTIVERASANQREAQLP